MIKAALGGETTCRPTRKHDPEKACLGLEHDPEKWMPVFRKDHAPTKKLDHDPIQFDRIMV